MKDFSVEESEPSPEQLRHNSPSTTASPFCLSLSPNHRLLSPTPLPPIPTPSPPSSSPSKDEENGEVPKSPYSSPYSGEQEKSNVEKRPCGFDWSEEMNNCLGDKMIQDVYDEVKKDEENKEVHEYTKGNDEYSVEEKNDHEHNFWCGHLVNSPLEEWAEQFYPFWIDN